MFPGSVVLHPMLGWQDHTAMPSFSLGVGDLNSGLLLFIRHFLHLLNLKNDSFKTVTVSSEIPPKKNWFWRSQGDCAEFLQDSCGGCRSCCCYLPVWCWGILGLLLSQLKNGRGAGAGMDITRRKQHWEETLSKVEFCWELRRMTGFPKMTVVKEELDS